MNNIASGVAQDRVCAKNDNVYPHVLVMTATPIPRTLAMTFTATWRYRPSTNCQKERKPIKTTHKFDSHRLEVNGFLKKQIEAGRQNYIVYPLIESRGSSISSISWMGTRAFRAHFPRCDQYCARKMKPDAKEFEMARFVKGEQRSWLRLP